MNKDNVTTLRHYNLRRSNAEQDNLRIMGKLAVYLVGLDTKRRYGPHHPRDLALVVNETVPCVIRALRYIGWTPTGGMHTARWLPPEGR